MEDLHEFFGMTIKNARMDCGLTQEALAERAGISCRYLIARQSHASGTMAFVRIFACTRNADRREQSPQCKLSIY